MDNTSPEVKENKSLTGSEPESVREESTKLETQMRIMKSSFDAAFDSVVKVQDITEKMLKDMIEKGKEIQADSLAIVNDFIENAKKVRDGYREMVNNTIEMEEPVKIKRGQEYYIHTEKLASLGRMAADFAHELKSPLTGIVTFAHLMMKRIPPENSMDREDLEAIVEQAHRCSKIIEGVLNFSRTIPEEKNEMKVNETLAHSIGMIKNQTKFHNIKIELETDNFLPPVKADSSQIEQVFLNLLINASDAMNNKGKISVRTSQTVEDEKPFVEVELTDTGLGIPEEHLPKLFDPFFTTKPVGEGTGLGLAVSHEIIKEHGGHIIVKSNPGEGTSFFIRLPIQKSEWK